MAFVKYEAEPGPAADVRVGKLGITITKSALDRHNLTSASHVNLYWDADTREVGISPAGAGDKSAFKINPRGKRGDKFIAAGKFYQRFGIVVDGRSAAAGQLVDRDGIVAFSLAPKSAAPTIRRRRRKSEAAAEEA